MGVCYEGLGVPRIEAAQAIRVIQFAPGRLVAALHVLEPEPAFDAEVSARDAVVQR
jgi:hypothetical protein